MGLARTSAAWLAASLLLLSLAALSGGASARSLVAKQEGHQGQLLVEASSEEALEADAQIGWGGIGGGASSLSGDVRRFRAIDGEDDDDEDDEFELDDVE
jgi:hypothetical protein